MMPPIVSSQPTSVIGLTGDPQRRSNTVATLSITAAAKAADTPIASILPKPGANTTASPNTVITAATIKRTRGRPASTHHERPITKNVCDAPTMPATLPGKRYDATKSKGKNAPKFRAASTALRHHQDPRGNCRVNARISRPTGSDRISASSSGRPVGKACVVSRYVVPHTKGATAVTRISRSRRIS